MRCRIIFVFQAMTDSSSAGPAFDTKRRIHVTTPTEKRVAYRTCPLCEATCGLEITLQGDKVVRIRGDHEDVLSRGFCCPKGSALGQLHEDPDRLRHPLVRRNGSFEAISWEEAFEEVEKGLMPIIEQGGRDAVSVFSGNPNAHTLSGMLYLRPFLQALKSKNIFSASTTDQMPRHVSCGLMFGGPGLIPVPDLDRTKYLLMLGANPFVSGGSLCTAPGFPRRLKAIRDRGGKVVVLDPVYTRTAKAAHEHHYIRPGTDALFLLGVVNTLFQEGLVSLNRLTDHVMGFEPVRDLADRFSPDRIAPICGIQADTTRRLAREIAAAPAAAVYGRIGTNVVSLGTINAWLIDLINILTGNLDRPGGVMFPRPGHSRPLSGPGGRGWRMGRWHSRVKGLPEVLAEFPVATLADEIETPGKGQIRALVTIAGNPVVSSPNANRLDRALTSLDFMVSIDFYLNETTRHAHVILPPPGPLCTGHYDVLLYNMAVRNVAHYSPPILPPDQNHLDKWEILLKLALIVAGQGATADPLVFDDFIMGQAAEGAIKHPHSSVADQDPSQLLAYLGRRKGPERMLDFMLRTGVYGDGFGKNPDGLSLDKLEAHPHGMDLGSIKPAVPEIIRTASGKIELAPSPIMEEVRRLESALELPEGLVLIGRRHIRSCNSWMHNIESLVKGPDRCTLLIHPEDAARLGLEEGAGAKITSRVGEVVVRVEISSDIMPGVVSLPHGWGHDRAGIRMTVAQAHPGVNSNILADEDMIDCLSGNAVLNGIPVTVEAAP
jgi:anaerobic selenocysteine-containing dehydrogenase